LSSFPPIKKVDPQLIKKVMADECRSEEDATLRVHSWKEQDAPLQRYGAMEVSVWLAIERDARGYETARQPLGDRGHARHNVEMRSGHAALVGGILAGVNAICLFANSHLGHFGQLHGSST
jgi:hypothetical protein